MNSLTNKLMSATLGLALVLGASVAMTAASAVVAPTEAAAKGFKGGARSNGQLGRKIVVTKPAPKINPVKEGRRLKDIGSVEEFRATHKLRSLKDVKQRS